MPPFFVPKKVPPVGQEIESCSSGAPPPSTSLRQHRCLTAALSGLLLPIALTCTSAAPGDENWDDRFAPIGMGRVNAVALVGTNLYAGGSFSLASGRPVLNLARWNGRLWVPVGSGVTNNTGPTQATVSALTVDGSNLYVGGLFTIAGGQTVNRIARWDGNNWHPLGDGVNGQVSAIAVMGSEVYVGGSFTSAGGVAATNIARWNGTTWSSLDGGLTCRWAVAS